MSILLGSGSCILPVPLFLLSMSPLLISFLTIFFVSPNQVLLAPLARRRAVPMTESEWVPVVCANDKVAKCRRTGITRADTEDMLSRERTHGLHNALLTNRR